MEKENKISIIINKPVNEVFEFTTNPENTPRWIKHIKEEQVNERPIKIGTVYKNTNNGKDWDTYTVIEFERNKLFTLKQQDSSYQVSYIYESLDSNKTKLIYFEKDEEGLNNPFSIHVLEELKLVLEEPRNNPHET